MKTTTMLLTAALCSMIAAAGCEKKPAPAPTKTTSTGTTAPTTGASLIPAGFFLTAAPEGAKPVEEVKAATPKVGDTVAISGRVGGSRNPFVDGRAVFTLMGPKLKACSDIEGEGCKYPWDYCCEKPADIAASAATIQVVDATGAPLRTNLKGEHGIQELSKITVVGKVAQIDGPNIVINATGMHVN